MPLLMFPENTNKTEKKDVLNVNMLEESKSNTKQMLTIENFYKN